MKTCTVQLKSITPYSASQRLDIPKLEKESFDDYEERNWREKATVDDDDDVVCIPAMGLKKAVDEAVKRLTIVIPGKKGATMTKFFKAGQLCVDMPGARRGVKKQDLECIKIWADSNGVSGSGTRVKRLFPYVREWEATTQFQILDNTITEEVFERVLVDAGKLVGVGRFRPENGGLLGRFSVEGFSWTRG